MMQTRFQSLGPTKPISSGAEGLESNCFLRATLMLWSPTEQATNKSPSNRLAVQRFIQSAGLINLELVIYNYIYPAFCFFFCNVIFRNAVTAAKTKKTPATANISVTPYGPRSECKNCRNGDHLPLKGGVSGLNQLSTALIAQNREPPR
jgi:hypothetical protein